jgi:hypothetical protein
MGTQREASRGASSSRAPEAGGGPRSPDPASRSSWRPIIVWTGGILLLAGLAWFVGAVAVPMIRMHRAVGRLPVKNYGPVIESLGGDEEACRLIGRSLYWPRFLAPDRSRAAWLLDLCKGGRGVLAEVLCDRGAPADARIAVAEFMSSETDNDMDDRQEWRDDVLAKVLEDPCGRLRVAAARSTLRRMCGSGQYDAALGQLVRCLKDEDVLVRRDAARALRELAVANENGPVTIESYRFAPVAEPALKEALGDADPTVRAEAAAALKCKLRKPVPRFGAGDG